MLQTLKNHLQKNRMLPVSLAALVLAVGLTIVPAANAAAVSCRVFTPKESNVGGGRVSTEILTVPGTSVSGCKDINVRDIKDPSKPGDTCATFRVAMYPSNGGPTYYSQPKVACSKGPNGPVVPIATNVLNGTKYQVIYDWEYLGQKHDFKIVD